MFRVSAQMHCLQISSLPLPISPSAQCFYPRRRRIPTPLEGTFFRMTPLLRLCPLRPQLRPWTDPSPRGQTPSTPRNRFSTNYLWAFQNKLVTYNIHITTVCGLSVVLNWFYIVPIFYIGHKVVIQHFGLPNVFVSQTSLT